MNVERPAARQGCRAVLVPAGAFGPATVGAINFLEAGMSRHRGDWDEDFYAGGPRRGEDEDRYGPPRGYEGGGPRRRYEQDERDAARGGGLRGWGLQRDDYDPRARAGGDYEREEYYAGRRPDPRDFEEEQAYERGRREREQYERERRRRSGPARSHLRCRDIMTRDVTVATRDTTLEQVARMMRDEDTGVIPIIEPSETTSDSVTEVQRVPARAAANGKLVGLITDRDIVIRAIADGMDARSVPAGEVMTTDLHTVRPNDRVIEAIRKMGDRQVRRLPVVDREGALRGIISMADIALETEADRELGEALEEISSGSSFWNRIFS